MEENTRESALHVSKQGICTCEIEYNGNYCSHVHMENDFVVKMICYCGDTKLSATLKSIRFFQDTKLSTHACPMCDGLELTYERQCRGGPSVSTTLYNGSRFRGPKVRASETLCFSLTTLGAMETLLYAQPLIAMAQGSEVQK